MKHSHKPSIILAAALLVASSGWQVAHAQREAVSRDDRRTQRQEQMAAMTPTERVQYFENRFNERLKTATPEQRDQMMAMRREVEQRMKDAGIEPTDPDAWQKMRDAGVFNGLGGQGGQNGQDDQNGQGDQRGNRGGRGGRGGRAERAAAEAMKGMMEAANLNDFDVQDAIVAYVAEQNKARATLFQLAQAAAGALQKPVLVPVNATDADGVVDGVEGSVAKTFAAYETAVAAENDRQEKALKELDAKINYSKTPRIKAFLTLVGILNNDVLALGGPGAVFAEPQRDGRNGGWNGQQGQGGRGGGRGGRG